jgi:glyoxylase-like metal-dependent hydrolase (beta-lactamase superfamily II)
VFDLADGNVGLVDTGLDPAANAIRAALARKGKSDADVRAIFFTHLHDDHASGARAFPAADVYVPASLAERIAASRGWAERTGATHGFQDGDRIELLGTSVEVFALPGHTPDSVAVLVHGVLFLGDSAGGQRGGRLGPNTLLSDDPEQTVSSLIALAERLEPRRADVRAIAFGHQGSVDGLSPLLEWAATAARQKR